jgi:hypothetical protein
MVDFRDEPLVAADLIPLPSPSPPAETVSGLEHGVEHAPRFESHGDRFCELLYNGDPDERWPYRGRSARTYGRRPTTATVRANESGGAGTTA